MKNLIIATCALLSVSSNAHQTYFESHRIDRDYIEALIADIQESNENRPSTMRKPLFQSYEVIRKTVLGCRYTELDKIPDAFGVVRVRKVDRQSLGSQKCKYKKQMSKFSRYVSNYEEVVRYKNEKIEYALTHGLARNCIDSQNIELQNALEDVEVRDILKGLNVDRLVISLKDHHSGKKPYKNIHYGSVISYGNLEVMPLLNSDKECITISAAKLVDEIKNHGDSELYIELQEARQKNDILNQLDEISLY